MQERIEDLADKLESGAEQLERKLAIARRANGGAVDPIVIPATAVGVMLYAARMDVMCEQLRALAGQPTQQRAISSRV
jgi:hypothetical protein